VKYRANAKLVMCLSIRKKSSVFFSIIDIMGTTNSKANSDLTPSTIDTNLWRLSLKNKAIIYSGWQEICRYSHTDWLHGISRKNYYRND
jgi:hypothetical protein